MKHRNRVRGKKAGRDEKMLARNVAKLKTFDTTHGRIILNPLKRYFLGKTYACQEYQGLLDMEIKGIVDRLEGNTVVDEPQLTT